MDHFRETNAFLDAFRGQIRSVLVHCVYGQSRSATICIVYMMKHHGMTVIEAYTHLQAARPCIFVNKGFMMQLLLFQQMKCTLKGETPYHTIVSEVEF